MRLVYGHFRIPKGASPVELAGMAERMARYAHLAESEVDVSLEIFAVRNVIRSDLLSGDEESDALGAARGWMVISWRVTVRGSAGVKVS